MANPMNTDNMDHNHPNWYWWNRRFFTRPVYLVNYNYDNFYYNQISLGLDRYLSNLNFCSVDESSARMSYDIRNKIMTDIAGYIYKTSNVTYRDSLISQLNQLSKLSTDYYTSCSDDLRLQQVSLVSQMKIQLSSYNTDGNVYALRNRFVLGYQY